MRSFILAAAIALFGIPAASAMTLDFESNGLSCASGTPAVTLTASPGSRCYVDHPIWTASNVLNIYTKDPANPHVGMQVDFAATVSQVSIDLGNAGGTLADPHIFLEVFDSAFNSLGYVGQLLNPHSSALETLSLSVAGIAHAVFGTDSNDHGFIAADNLTWNESSVAAVPVPAALPLMAGALAGLGMIGRRRRRNAA